MFWGLMTELDPTFQTPGMFKLRVHTSIPSYSTHGLSQDFKGK